MRACVWWVGVYTILFHGSQCAPVLNAKPRTHPCNEVLKQVRSVPAEQAAAAAEQFLLKDSRPASVTAKAAVTKQSHSERSKHAFALHFLSVFVRNYTDDSFTELW